MIALNYIYLSPKHAGGKDQVGFNLLEGFEILGLARDMAVICFDYSADLIRSISPSIKIISLPSKSTKGEISRMLHLTYVNTFVIPKVIKENNITLIYHLSCNTGLFKFKCKSVVIPHDIKAVSHRVLANVKIPFYKYIIYKMMYEIDFRNNDRVIAISDTDKSEIKEFYPKYQDKVIRIYDPVKTIRAANRSPYFDFEYICAINLQFHHKNIITLIKAFEKIKDEVNCKLVLVGSVPHRVSYLKDYVMENKLEDSIIFTGFVSDEDMKRILVNSRLYVNPTLNEGFGMTAVEALIEEVPTLLSKIPTNYEVTKGLCWYYEPPEDSDILAATIKDCLNKSWDNSKEKSKTMTDAYDVKVIAQEYYKMFSSL